MTDDSRRILIVEDDADTAELLVQQLERDDLVLEVARNGQEAILVTGEQPPDMLIMDLMMPRLDGHEASRFLKAKFRESYVPILVLTAKDDPTSRGKSARFGCDDYMTKPYQRKALVQAVEELLELSQLENRLIEARVVTAQRAEYEVMYAQASEEDREALHAPPEPIDTDGCEARIVELRLQVAERQIGAGAPELVNAHLERVLELSPDHARAKELMGRLGSS